MKQIRLTKDTTMTPEEFASYDKVFPDGFKLTVTGSVTIKPSTKYAEGVTVRIEYRKDGPPEPGIVIHNATGDFR